MTSEHIADRTRTALQVLKARGVKLGSARPGHWDGREHVRQAGLAKARTVAVQWKRAQAQAAYAHLLPAMQELRREGKSFQAIADELNARGERVRGRPWSAMQVWRVLRRADRLAVQAATSATQGHGIELTCDRVCGDVGSPAADG